MSRDVPAYVRAMGPEGDLPSPRAPDRTLVIATTQRSASSMLSGAIGDLGLLGDPREYCDGTALAALCERFEVSDGAQMLRRLAPLRTTPNGVFAIKLHYVHFLDVPALHDLRAVLPDPRLVLLERDDMIAQAVSLSWSAQTRRFSADAPAVAEACYDPALIAECLAMLGRHVAAWRCEAARQALPTIRVTSEEATADLPGTLARIAAHMGVSVDPAELPAQPPTRPMPREGDRAEWPARFRADAPAAPPFAVGRVPNPHAPPPAPPPAPRPRPSLAVRARRRLGRMVRGR